MSNNKVTPEIRFKDFIDPWEQRKLSSIVERVTRKNSDLESMLPLTISAVYGLVDQNIFFKKQIASKDVSNYYLIKKGEFAYNKSYSNGFPWGAIKRLDNYDMGVLSTLYILFKPININSEFLVSYYDTNYWHKEVSRRAAEGARNHGLLNITAKDFFDTSLYTPSSKEEQESIGYIFNRIEETIALHQHELTLLKQRKKAFLQKMFPKKEERTPDVRFSGFYYNWNNRVLGELVDISTGKLDANAMKENGEYDFYTSGIKKFKIDTFSFEGPAITIAGNGATVGYMHYADGKFNAYQRTYVLTNFRSIREFIYLEIERKLPRKIKKEARTGNIPYIVMEMLTNLEIQIPAIEEQEEIGNFFKQLDEDIELHEQKTKTLKQMKKAFLQKMFV